jgi:hypothetical protein
VEAQVTKVDAGLAVEELEEEEFGYTRFFRALGRLHALLGGLLFAGMLVAAVAADVVVRAIARHEQEHHAAAE